MGERLLVPKHYQRGRALTPQVPNSSVETHPRPHRCYLHSSSQGKRKRGSSPWKTLSGRHNDL
jgi:hypothetical protein